MKKIRVLFLICFYFLLVACSQTISKQKDLSKQGLKSMNEVDFGKAIEKFDEALVLGSERKDLYNSILSHKALSQFELGLYSESVNTLRNIDSLNNEYKSLLVITLSREGKDLKSAYEYLNELAATSAKEDIYTKAVDEFLRAVMTNTSTDNIVKDFDMTAIKDLNIKEYNKKKTANNVNNMGIFEYVDGNYDKALEYFDVAMNIAGEKKDVNIQKSILFNRAACYEYKLEPQKAIELFEEYINTYGEDEAVSHELIFLKSRIKEN